ncbi:acyltransferase family protein [Dyella caseinilytica]|uniref:Acyltransferase n=1 Tax=Dyella caseinilytica TaxID=1849581 RepID=A0ABX7GXT5_9GAMM|nr:acyltransferase [Dyella caseinilytica]QRN55266.1 acyltransferase [Dyella caseinilytica]GGA00567.1 acyltransferase [Dyella caseinilytica]
MERTKDFTQNGFTLIRIIAASLVIITHTYVVLGYAQGDPFERRHLLGLSKLGVDTFFVISGYLVALSAQRSANLFQFAMKRLIRIVPGLAVVTLLTVFVLGPLLTSADNYFSQSSTWTYLGHILVFNQQKELPGLFANNPVQAVNASLWTLAIEVACYGALMALIWAGGMRSRILFLIVMVMLGLHLNDTFRMDKFFLGVFQLRLNECGMLFFYGALLATLNDRLRPSWAVSALFVCAIAAGFIYSKADWHYSALIYLTLWPYTIITSALLLKRMACLNRFDISYGTYIYGFVIQQCLVSVIHHRNVGLFILASLLLSYAAGALSWFLVERPAMRLKGMVFGRRKSATVASQVITTQTI